MKGRQKCRGVGGKVRTVVQLALIFVCHHWRSKDIFQYGALLFVARFCAEALSLGLIFITAKNHVSFMSFLSGEKVDQLQPGGTSSEMTFVQSVTSLGTEVRIAHAKS